MLKSTVSNIKMPESYRIASIDAKDIYLSRHYVNKVKADDYSLRLSDGQINFRKFINDYEPSLDLISINDIYHMVFRRRDFGFKVRKRLYTTQVINLTFKYSVKEWNQMSKKVYVKFGYNHRELDFIDGIARNDDNEIVGIVLGVKIETPVTDLPKIFSSVNVEIKHGDSTEIQYRKVKEPKTVKTNAQLRTELYKTGFSCDGIKYCRMKRSTGSARAGKCLFVNEPLMLPILVHSSGGYIPKLGDEIDLAAYEGYIALPASSIIDVMVLKPENILLVDDYDSVFNEDVIATKDENGWLRTTEENGRIINSIWDGESLIDSSALGKYDTFGMVLLRNLMFKSACFNCNMQLWFQDNGITDVSQLNGYTRATKIEDIKLITTPSSIKYLKFDTIDNWLDNLYPIFGIVKHDKPTHYFGGRMVQTHYQLLNTLQMSKAEMEQFIQPSLDFAQLLRDNPAVTRYYIKYPDIDDMSPMTKPMNSKNDIVYNLLSINDNFTQTKYYHEFLFDLLKSYYSNLKKGHVYVNGNYSTLLGNPIELLQQSIGVFLGDSQIGVGNIHSTRFEYDKVLLGSRSPHVTIGNILVTTNKANETIDKYINLTNEIVCINSIGENTLQRLSGADFDSDTMLLTDNEILINVAKRNYSLFKTPTSFVSATKVKRYYTPEQQADLDIKTSVNLIGEIINLSQELNSLLWDRMYSGETYDDIKELYYDICQLDIMSGIEIDSAKKEFEINNKRELDKLRKKYKIMTENGDKRKKVPYFFAHISRKKGYYDPVKKHYCKYNTSMDYLQTIINSHRVKTNYKKKWLPFVSILDNTSFRTSDINQKQINKIYSLLKAFVLETKNLFGSDVDMDYKLSKYKLLKTELIDNINCENIGFSTLYRLLTSLEDKENAKIKNVLMSILWMCSNKSFNKAIIHSRQEIEQLEDGGNDICLFDIGYAITRKEVNSEMNSQF